MELRASDLDHPILCMLACAAVEPGLRSILVLNATVTQLFVLDRVLQEMLAAAGEYAGLRKPSARILTVYDSEDALWGSAMMPSDQGRRMRWQRGILAMGRRTPLQRLLVPDLAQASLNVLRACTVAAYSDVIHVERNGRRIIEAPNFVWLAGCAASDLGKISPHLLDRFSFRFAIAGPKVDYRDNRVQLLLQLLQRRHRHAHDEFRVKLDDGLAQRLRAAAVADTALTPAALDMLCQTDMPGVTMRRLEVLARVAATCARIAGAGLVETEHVEQAKKLLGLTAEPVSAVEPLESLNEEYETDGSTGDYRPSDPEPAVPPITSQSSEQSTTPSDVRLEFLPEVLQVPASVLFGEDSAPAERPADPLRLPTGRRHYRAQTRGPVIGVEPALSLRDLAITGTLLEAAKYQPIRHSGQGRTGGMIILPCDLRRHRRTPLPEQAFVLLVDYTALRSQDWPQRLMPLLQWAYGQRASVHLIRVGAHDAAHELLADQSSFRSVLAKRFAPLLFETRAGRATPLAHGLALAQQSLLHLLQSGRSSLVKVRLVVLSDGRGNVPLAASAMRKATAEAARTGVADAIAVAQQVAAIKRVETYVVDLEPPHRPEYQQMLADALGARLFRP